VPAQDSTAKYYRTSQSAGVWTAFIVMIGVIGGGSSLAEHSLALTASLLTGCAVVWYAGYWLLSKNLYFISSTKAGFKDLFRNREVQFADVRSATRRVAKDRQDLIFQCADGASVWMPLDPLDQSWLTDVKAELAIRGIAVTTTAFGIPTGK
jgi:hypothetical protein